MKHPKNSQSGFTLVEITLAMAIFSFMLLVVSVAYINIARLYTASTSARNVQQNNRFAVEQITRVARSAGSATTSDKNSDGGVSWICFNSKVGSQLFYLESLGVSYKNNLHQVAVGSCPTPDQPPNVAGVSGNEVINSDNTYAARLVADTSAGRLATFSLWMVSKTDLLDTTDPNTLQCKSGPGNEFCAVNKLTTTVEMRGE